MFDSVGHKASWMFFRVDQYFDFIIVKVRRLQSDRSIFIAILEIVGTSVLSQAKILSMIF